MTKIRMSATYEILTWSDEPDTEPEREGGFTDPNNPWGGLRYELPAGCVGDAAAAWMAENVTYVEFDDIEEAGQFVAEFPGGVWDWEEAEPQPDSYTGNTMAVTLHVDSDHRPAVFSAADRSKNEEERRIKERMTR